MAAWLPCVNQGRRAGSGAIMWSMERGFIWAAIFAPVAPGRSLAPREIVRGRRRAGDTFLKRRSPRSSCRVAVMRKGAPFVGLMDGLILRNAWQSEFIWDFEWNFVALNKILNDKIKLLQMRRTVRHPNIPRRMFIKGPL